MRELRSCDFCGGDAAGTFEIVPPELEPTETEQRRVVLCPDCKERLETLVEPLLARAGADDAATVDEGDEEDEADPTAENGSETGTEIETEPESGTVVASADASTRKRSRASSPNATVSGDEPEPGVGDDAATESPSDPDRVPESERESRSASSGVDADEAAADADDDAADAGGDPPEPALEDGITFGGDDATDDRTADETADTGDGDDAGESAVENATATNDSNGSDAATRPPNAYGKVIRLLRNREFPMKRSAVEDLAAGAYDLDPAEVDAIVDHAIEQGEFVEKRGKLTRP